MSPAIVEVGTYSEAFVDVLKDARSTVTITQKGVEIEVSKNRVRLLSIPDAQGRKRARFHYTSDGTFQAMSIHDAVTDKLESYRIAMPRVAAQPPPPERRKSGSLVIQDLEDYEEMVRQAAEYLFNTENFYLDWDFLADWARNDDSRKSCMSNCENTCDAGNATMGILCGIGAGLLVPTVAGVIGGAIGCYTFGVWYGEKCKKECPWRCR